MWIEPFETDRSVSVQFKPFETEPNSLKTRLAVPESFVDSYLFSRIFSYFLSTMNKQMRKILWRFWVPQTVTDFIGK